MLKTFDDLQVLVDGLLRFDVDADCVTEAFAEALGDHWEVVAEEFGVTVEAICEWSCDVGMCEEEIDELVDRLAAELFRAL